MVLERQVIHKKQYCGTACVVTFLIVLVCGCSNSQTTALQEAKAPDLISVPKYIVTELQDARINVPGNIIEHYHTNINAIQSHVWLTKVEFQITELEHVLISPALTGVVWRSDRQFVTKSSLGVAWWNPSEFLQYRSCPLRMTNALAGGVVIAYTESGTAVLFLERGF